MGITGTTTGYVVVIVGGRAGPKIGHGVHNQSHLIPGRGNQLQHDNSCYACMHVCMYYVNINMTHCNMYYVCVLNEWRSIKVLV